MSDHTNTGEISMSEEYLTPDDVMQRLHLTRSSLYRRIQDGTLPKPIKLGHLSRFRASEIEEALDKLAQRRPETFSRRQAAQ
ncbi:helix-turn-helix domain-containing protein [Phaeobacter inhibens]|uniref:helix-turn-helix transcriptional regulator n=1 Tax=Phaeobacter inhibens TaxID=221822 RepID=UPI0021A5883C|nr:helix-turn-helix domain-containing protein [Phaeobacter inhibens]UWR64824.1 helix-turn-helix domain-containing protein [Phaeobacter inhibens]